MKLSVKVLGKSKENGNCTQQTDPFTRWGCVHIEEKQKCEYWELQHNHTVCKIARKYLLHGRRPGIEPS